MFKSFWIKKKIIDKINDSYQKENIFILGTYKNEGFNILEEVKTTEHPLIDSVKNLKYKNVFFFMSEYPNSDILEKCFVLIKKENTNKFLKMEKLLTILCQTKENKLKNFMFQYRNYKKLTKFF
jgi:hypothetical protein